MEKLKGKTGQLKIQQMAFVLIAMVIFFVIIVLIYLKIRVADIESRAQMTGDEYAKEVVAKLANSPEFSWIEDCATCVDMDKTFALKSSGLYKNFWNLDYLQVEVLYPSMNGECTAGNYPNCKTITLINKTSQFGAGYPAFVNVCRTEGEIGNSYIKCGLGRIWASGSGVGSKK